LTAPSIGAPPHPLPLTPEVKQVLPPWPRVVLRRRVVGVSLLLALILALTAASAGASTAVKVSGTVVCANGRSVVGIWFQFWGDEGSSAPLSDWRRMPGATNVAQYSQWVAGGSTISLHVRCAGRRRARWSDSRTAKIQVRSSEVVNTLCRHPSKPGALRCQLPRIGLTAPDDRNHFDAGWCTWGAAKMLHRATGQYPGWFGNAKDWAEGAKGWLVSSEPMAHSIFVFPAGVDSSQSGHVGWVDRVEYRPGGVDLHTTEMNGWHGGLFSWSHERTKYERSMRFILVPDEATSGKR
jgi:hypothetical protein